MNQSAQTIQEDFDRIALVSDHAWDNNTHYHNYLIEKVPAHCNASLEIGCGAGAFSRMLAERSEQVIAIDLSEQMIRIASLHSQQYMNIKYEVADAMSRRFSEEEFNCIVSIATLHHLPVEIILSEIKRILKPGGVFIGLDLFRAEGLLELLTGVLSFPLNTALRLIKTGRLREPYEVRKAWEEHAKSDSYLTINQVREIGGRILPGVEVKRHLFWRYSIIWKKP